MALTEEEKKKKAQAEYAKKQEMLKSAKKSGTTEPKMSKEEAQKSVKEQNKKVVKDAKEEKRIMAGRTDSVLYKNETKSEEPKSYNYTSPAQKRTQQISESIADKTTPAKFSAKAISSEAEKDYNKLPISPIQRGKQTVGENIARLAGVEQETLDDIRAKAIPKFGKDVFSESVDSGVANYISNLTGSLGKIYELSPSGFIANSLNKAIYGETRNPFEAINEPLQKWQEKEALEAQKAVENTGKGKSAENASRLITMATEMAPSVALSFIPGGQASSIANAAGTLGKVKGGFKALTSAKTFFPTLQQMTLSTIKDPVFWNSFGQILYPEYEEAVAKGASEGEATATALLSAFGQSALEKNFGIEKLPEAGAQTVKQAVFDFVKSAVGEGNEEVIQSVISGITQKLIFDHDQKLVSTSPEEDAVLNMANAFDEWIMAVAAGGVMGIPGALVNAGNIKAEANTNTSAEPVVEPSVSPAEAPIVEAENVTPETANEQEGAFANAARRIKQLQDDRYFVEVTLKNLENQNPITAARDRVVWDEKLKQINNEIESIIREVSPEALESNAQFNSTDDAIEPTNDVIESANAREKAEPFSANNVDQAKQYLQENWGYESNEAEDVDDFEDMSPEEIVEYANDFYFREKFETEALSAGYDFDENNPESVKDYLKKHGYSEKDISYSSDEELVIDAFNVAIKENIAKRHGFSDFSDFNNWSIAERFNKLTPEEERYIERNDNTEAINRYLSVMNMDENLYNNSYFYDIYSLISDEARLYNGKDDIYSVSPKAAAQAILEAYQQKNRNPGSILTRAFEIDGKKLPESLREEYYPTAEERIKKVEQNIYYYKDMAGYYDAVAKKAEREGNTEYAQRNKVNAQKQRERVKELQEQLKTLKKQSASNAQVNSTNDVVNSANDVVEQANAQPRAQENVNTQNGAHPNTVGGMESNPNSYSYMQNNFGTYLEGEKASRVVDSPISTDGTNRVNRFNRTMQEAEVTPEELIPTFEKAVEDGTFSYEIETDKSALEYAKKEITKNGYADSISSFMGKVEGDKVLAKKDLAIGEMLYAEAAQMGDAQTAMKLASSLAHEFTKAGQAVQAARLLKKLTPEGRLYNAQKLVDRFNENEHRPSTQEDIKIDETLAQNLLKAKTEQEIENAEEAIKENIAEQLVSTKMDKWNAWRYLSMLGNPKTHIRNVMGNAMFVPARALKNGIKATLEKGYAAKHKNYERTTTIAKATDAQKNFAKESFEKNKNKLLSGGNYRFESDIESKKKVFDNKALEWARNKNSELLEKEDIVFLKRAYVDSLAKYLRANNIDPQKADAKQIAKAEGYAEQEAKKATYRDESKVAQSIERLSRTNGVTRVLSDALLPFRKTPINILARGVEYSPVELAKALTYDMAKVKKGEMEPQKMLDHIASGLTGTGVVALGALLAHLDLISGGDNEDDKAQNFGELQGEQNYAFKIGDYSYTLDWATPISMPLFVGVEAYNALKGEGFDSGDVFNATLNAISKTADPMIGLSMLQNVEKLLSGNYGGEGSGLGNVIKEATISYVLQAFPTLGTQIAQTIDPKQRNAYYTDKTNEIPDILEIPLNRVLAKIPLASQLLPERVDEWGRTEKQEENIALRIFENFASPGYISKNKSTEVDEMLKQLYKDTGNASVLPSNMQKYVTVGGNKKDLSAQEYVDAQKKAGSTKYDMLNQLIKDNDFKKLSAEEKASIVSDVYSYGTVKGKQEVSNYVPAEKWYKNIEEAKKEGVSAPDYLVAKNFYNNIETKEGGRSKNLQMLDQLIADKGTSEKQDVVLLEYVAGVDMKKYKSATTEPSEMLELYEVVSNGDKKEEDIKVLHQKGYSKAEALAKYNVADGTKKYENGEFKFGNSTKQKAKAERLAKKGYSPEEIVKAANAVTSIGKYGTSKSYSTCIKMLKAVGITDKKFQNDFYNIYFG